jgi:hypothetical protein
MCGIASSSKAFFLWTSSCGDKSSSFPSSPSTKSSGSGMIPEDLSTGLFFSKLLSSVVFIPLVKIEVQTILIKI